MSHVVDQSAGEPAGSPKVVVIGFGSPIRGDDAFGPLVADRLADLIGGPQVEVLSRHILTAELAETVRDASLVVFIDAATTGEVGQVVQHRLAARREREVVIVHAVDPPGLLAWTEALYGRTPAALLLSTRGVSFDFAHCQLSADVQSAVEPTVQLAQTLVRDHLADSQRR